jgi:hypothetical protein
MFSIGIWVGTHQHPAIPNFDLKIERRPSIFNWAIIFKPPMRKRNWQDKFNGSWNYPTKN